MVGKLIITFFRLYLEMFVFLFFTLFYPLICFADKKDKTFKNTFEVTTSIIMGMRYPLPTLELNYERRLTKKFSLNIEGKIFLILPLPFIEVGTRYYPKSKFEGLYLYGGFESFIPIPISDLYVYRMFRFPFTLGYKKIFSSGFTINPFLGASFDIARTVYSVGMFKIYITESKDEHFRWMVYVTPFFNIYFGYSW